MCKVRWQVQIGLYPEEMYCPQALQLPSPFRVYRTYKDNACPGFTTQRLQYFIIDPVCDTPVIPDPGGRDVRQIPREIVRNLEDFAE